MITFKTEVRIICKPAHIPERNPSRHGHEEIHRHKNQNIFNIYYLTFYFVKL